MHCTADDEGEPDEYAKEEDARCRVAAHDLLGECVLPMPHLDDEEAENEEHDADCRVDDAEHDPLHEVGRDGVVGGGEDHGTQDLPDAGQRNP